MSRFGITFEDVADAADAVLKNGETPTIDKIRAALGGTGSFTTISKHLHAWRQNSVLPNAQSKIPTPDIVQSAVERVWQEIQKEAQAEIDQVRTEAREQIETALKQMQHAEESYAILERQHHDLSQSHHRLSAEKELLLVDLKSLREEYRLLQERYLALDERYTDMKQATTQHLKDLAEGHKQEFARLEEKSKQQREDNEKLIHEIKHQYDVKHRDDLALIDSLKAESQMKNRIIQKIETHLKERERIIEKLTAKYDTLEAERNMALTYLVKQENHIKALFGKALVDAEWLNKLDTVTKMTNQLERIEFDIHQVFSAKLVDINNLLIRLNQRQTITADEG